MNKLNYQSVLPFILAAGVVLSSSAIAQQSSALNPAQHPESPSYAPVYPKEILPLDSKLSWTNRFNDNEEFNENEKLTLTTNASAESAMDHTKHSKLMPSNTMEMDGTGMIKQIKVDQGKIKIQHGVIDRLGMPAMTMVFKVDDVSMLAGFEKGQEVSFSVDNSSKGFVITEIIPRPGEEPMAMKHAAAKGVMDAKGTVKSIRESQGKIKIEHGPIESLGMPGMTMLFKIEDTSLLKDIVKGSEVIFSVDNSAGGFVITNIKPIN